MIFETLDALRKRKTEKGRFQVIQEILERILEFSGFWSDLWEIGSISF